MRTTNAKQVIVVLVLAGLVACGGDSLYSPGGGNGGGGGGGGGDVTVGPGIEFTSRHNASSNLAVDTIAVGTTFTWRWSGSEPHSVRSVGTPSFTSSAVLTGNGQSYSFTFTTPGLYEYDCAVHGQAMRGRILVRAATTPNPAPGYSVTAADPTGDTFGTAAAPWDVTAMSLTADASAITATLDFSRDVVSPLSGDPAAVIAFLDLDLDQRATTGGIAVADEFRLDGGSTALGVDARVNVAEIAADGTVGVLDGIGREIGRVKPEFSGRRITVAIPRSILGNVAGVNAAAIVGRVGGASDFVPNAGHLTLSPDAPASP